MLPERYCQTCPEKAIRKLAHAQFQGNLSEGINFVDFVLIDYSANTTASWGSISGIATAGPAGHIPYQLALVPHQLAPASGGVLLLVLQRVQHQYTAHTSFANMQHNNYATCETVPYHLIKPGYAATGQY